LSHDSTTSQGEIALTSIEEPRHGRAARGRRSPSDPPRSRAHHQPLDGTSTADTSAIIPSDSTATTPTDGARAQAYDNPDVTGLIEAEEKPGDALP